MCACAYALWVPAYNELRNLPNYASIIIERSIVLKNYAGIKFEGVASFFIQGSHTYTCTCMDHTAVDDVLDVWGELVPSTHHSQFSRLAIQCPTLCDVCLEWVNGVGFFLFLNFLFG